MKLRGLRVKKIEDFPRSYLIELMECLRKRRPRGPKRTEDQHQR